MYICVCLSIHFWGYNENSCQYFQFCFVDHYQHTNNSKLANKIFFENVFFHLNLYYCCVCYCFCCCCWNRFNFSLDWFVQEVCDVCLSSYIAYFSILKFFFAFKALSAIEFISNWKKQCNHIGKTETLNNIFK